MDSAMVGDCATVGHPKSGWKILSTTNKLRKGFVCFVSLVAPEICLKWDEEDKRIQEAKTKCPN